MNLELYLPRFTGSGKADSWGGDRRHAQIRSPTRHATRYCACRGRDAVPEKAHAQGVRPRRGPVLESRCAGWVRRLGCPGDRMRQGLSVDAVLLTASERRPLRSRWASHQKRALPPHSGVLHKIPVAGSEYSGGDVPCDSGGDKIWKERGSGRSQELQARG
jgi:hypothetical protein